MLLTQAQANEQRASQLGGTFNQVNGIVEASPGSSAAFTELRRNITTKRNTEADRLAKKAADQRKEASGLLKEIVKTITPAIPLSPANL